MIAAEAAAQGVVQQGLGLRVIGIVMTLMALLCGACWAWGFAVAHVATAKAVATEQQACAADQLKAVEKAQQRFDADMKAGADQARALQADLAARDRLINDLKRSLKHAPAVVSTAACAAPGDLHLSAGAVRLYDAAFGSVDFSLPAGARGTAADATGPCAADGSGCEQPSAVTVDQYTATAQANAQSYGICMARMQSLVDFIRKRQGAAAR